MTIRSLSDSTATSYPLDRETISLDVFASASVLPRSNPQAGNNESINLKGVYLKFEHVDLIERDYLERGERAGFYIRNSMATFRGQERFGTSQLFSSTNQAHITMHFVTNYTSQFAVSILISEGSMHITSTPIGGIFKEAYLPNQKIMEEIQKSSRAAIWKSYFGNAHMPEPEEDAVEKYFGILDGSVEKPMNKEEYQDFLRSLKGKDYE